jgi:hypothetical protein
MSPPTASVAGVIGAVARHGEAMIDIDQFLRCPLGIVAQCFPYRTQGKHRTAPVRRSRMTENADYTPPKIWTWEKENGGRFASINRPIAGPTHDKELPVGRHPLQLYSLGTPNGVKVTILLEELLALGHSGAEYDAWLIKIS